MLFLPLSLLQTRKRNSVTELVNAHARALQQGRPGPEAQLAFCDEATATEARELFALAERLNRALTPVAPDEHFVRDLYERLRSAEVPVPSLAERIRRLPPRKQWAAAGIGGAATLTVTAGVVWIAWRSESRLLGLLRRRFEAA